MLAKCFDCIAFTHLYILAQRTLLTIQLASMRLYQTYTPIEALLLIPTCEQAIFRHSGETDSPSVWLSENITVRRRDRGCNFIGRFSVLHRGFLNQLSNTHIELILSYTLYHTLSVRGLSKVIYFEGTDVTTGTCFFAAKLLVQLFYWTSVNANSVHCIGWSIASELSEVTSC